MKISSLEIFVVITGLKKSIVSYLWLLIMGCNGLIMANVDFCQFFLHETYNMILGRGL